MYKSLTHLIGLSGIIVVLCFAGVADASTLYSQSVTLSPGWNVVSTPRVLDSHSFSATENSTNFDIYILDASQTSGWATMAQEGQTEFTPLYGYFIDNKTSATQTLTFNYKDNTDPNSRLFQRTLSTTGWYSIGVANATYATSVGTTTNDTNNPSQVLSALSGNYSTAVDFTDGSYASSQDSVGVASAWKAATASDVNSLNDLRETKGYAVYVTNAGALYNGFQNNNIVISPTVTTQSASSITQTTATLNGNITATGGANATVRGFAWGTNSGLSGGDTATTTTNGSFGTGAFTNTSLTLVCNTTYYFRAYATNSAGTSFGAISASFTTSACTPAPVIQNASSVASQNITKSTPNQVLGGFDADFSSEPVTVQGMVFTIATSSSGGPATGLTSVVIVDSNGSVVAGPVDQSGITLTFNNSITFPVGTHTYTIKGTVPSGWVNGETVTLNTTPSGWTSPQGQSSGNSITISTGNFTMNTMTVHGAVLSLSMSSTPASQTLVAGAQNATFANVQLDASQSGEDVRISSLPLTVTESGTTPGNFLSNCGLWNGSTLLTSGSNVVNTISNTSPATVSFTFDNPVTVAKGTVTTLALSCNISSSATNQTYAWSVPAASSISSVTGVQSGNSVTSSNGLTTSATPGGTMTIAGTATVAVTIDASSPSYALVAGGTTGVTVGVIKFRSSNEGVSLTKLGLTLANGTYSGASGAQDIIKAYLYYGSSLFGTAIFAGNATTATSTLASALTLPVNTDTLLAIKIDTSDIGIGQPGTEGDLVKVDPLSFEGTGISSGTTVRGGATAGVAGVRLVNTFPTISQDTLPSTGIADGRLMRFKITADSHNDVGVYQFKFTVATSTATVSNVALYTYVDSGYSSPISGQGTGGQIGSTIASIGSGAFSINPTSNPIEVPAGSTFYFELRATVAGVQTGSSVVTTLQGDSSFSGMLTASNVSGNFVWSPNATTTTAFSVSDWTNSYGVVGLPASGLTQTRSN